MIVLGVAAIPERDLPVPLDQGCAIVPLLDDGAQKLTSERVHGLTHPQLRLLERLGTRVRAKLLVKDCDHLGENASATRSGTPERSMHEGAGERDTDMGTLMMLGLRPHSILPTLAIRSVPTFPRSALSA